MTLGAGSLKLFSTNTSSANTKLIAGSGNDGVVGVVVVNTANQACPALNLSNWTGGATSTGPYISFDNSTFGGWSVGSGNATNSFDICTTWGTPLVRVDASGKLLVNTTDNTFASAFITSSSAGKAGEFRTTDAASGYSAMVVRRTASDGAAMELVRGTSYVGSIGVTTTGASFNTTSDYRLKDVIGPVSGSGARIDALQPVEYTWKADGSHTRGFLAHQFQAVYAGSVVGTKDAVDADGKPVYQSMQAGSSEVIADLVAEIKSLRQRLAAACIP
jgi:hypothetical protein